ncbi:MAG: hypothetical protein KDA68_19490, partial [Planctomycetaceae bacterium]|nr:hypothetical protein [Planctomycetaceae bacterium]
MPEGTANPDHLPDDPALLKGLVRELLATIQDERRRNEQLAHRLDLLLKQVYGPRADTLDPRQMLLFESPSTEITPTAPLPMEPEVITTTVKHT